MTKSEAGRKGGRATVQKYGRSYMREIGRKGAETFWRRYRVLPVGVSQYGLVEKDSGKLLTIYNSSGRI